MTKTSTATMPVYICKKQLIPLFDPSGTTVSSSILATLYICQHLLFLVYEPHPSRVAVRASGAAAPVTGEIACNPTPTRIEKRRYTIHKPLATKNMPPIAGAFRGSKKDCPSRFRVRRDIARHFPSVIGDPQKNGFFPSQSRKPHASFSRVGSIQRLPKSFGKLLKTSFVSAIPP